MLLYNNFMTTIYKWLKNNNSALLLLFLIFMVPVFIFFKLAREVIEKEVIPFDIPILDWLHYHSNPFFDVVFFSATTLGGLLGVLAITGSLLAIFVVKKQPKRALILLASVGGATIANLLLKTLFQRDRPNIFETFVVETTYSFPSGHAMASSALALCLVLIFWQTKWRWLITSVAAIFVILVGISRPYFGVHYPSDILAGWSASTAWVLIVYYLAGRLNLKFKSVGA